MQAIRAACWIGVGEAPGSLARHFHSFSGWDRKEGEERGPHGGGCRGTMAEHAWRDGTPLIHTTFQGAPSHCSSSTLATICSLADLMGPLFCQQPFVERKGGYEFCALWLILTLITTDEQMKHCESRTRRPHTASSKSQFKCCSALARRI